MPPPPPPALPEDVLEEIFLRLPPDEPACLVRASLASKLWLGLFTGHGFRGRYREFHGAPPMLGFVHQSPHIPRSGPRNCGSVPLFVSTMKFGVHVPEDDTESGVTDCRHGRVLLMNKDVFVVWDPMTGCRTEFNKPEGYKYGQTAAVLCAVTGCDHRACHEGPFRVVFLGLKPTHDGVYLAHAHEFLSEVGEWSDTCLDLASEYAFRVPIPPVLIQGKLYFMVEYEDGHGDERVRILKYDLCSKCLSLIDAPFLEVAIDLVASSIMDALLIDRVAILLGMEDGSLGFALMDGFTLNLWSGRMFSNQDTVWTPRIVIDLKEMLSIQNLKQTIRPIGSVEGSDILFVTTDLGIYEINLKSLAWKKIWKSGNFGVSPRKFGVFIPYTSFYNRQEGRAPLTMSG